MAPILVIQMTHLNALTTAPSSTIESSESRIQHLRADATKRLEAASYGNDDLVAVCRTIFDILALQDKISLERHRISSLNEFDISSKQGSYSTAHSSKGYK